MLDSSLSTQLKAKGLEPEIKAEKKAIQEILLLLQVHPCYIVKILKSRKLKFDEQKLLIKQLFASNKKSGVLRNNYLLISIFEAILPFELQEHYEKIERGNASSSGPAKTFSPPHSFIFDKDS